MSALSCLLPDPYPGSSGRALILILVLLFVAVLSVLGYDPALALGVALTAVTALAPLELSAAQIERGR